MHAQDWINSTMRNMRRPLTMPPIVGLCGPAGAGKDTAAFYLHSNHGYATLRFADPMKRALQAMFGIPLSVWDDREEKEKPIDWLGVSPRRLAQTLGHDWGRKLISEDVWLRVMERRIQDLPTRRVVVSDVRYNNEAALLRRMGGVVLKIERPGAPTIAPHASEAGIDPLHIAHTVVNVGTVEQLWEATEFALSRLGAEA